MAGAARPPATGETHHLTSLPTKKCKTCNFLSQGVEKNDANTSCGRQNQAVQLSAHSAMLSCTPSLNDT